MLGLRQLPFFFDTSQRGVNAVVVIPNRRRGHRIIRHAGVRFGQIGVTHGHDHFGVGDRVVGRTISGGFGSFALHLTALVEEVLRPSAVREVSDIIEFRPQPIDLTLAFFVEDQLHQRRVVAIKAHHAVIAGTQQTALVFGIIREIAAAFGDVELVGENGGEARKRRFILAPLRRRHYQIQVPGSRFGRQRRPARSPFLMQPRIARNGGDRRGRLVVIQQILRIALPPMRRILLQLPVEQGLRTRGQAGHLGRGELHGGMVADLDHKILHLPAFGAESVRLGRQR